MISPELLEILRCPIDPERKATLTVEGDHLLCGRCRVVYKIKDGFPVMVVEEADLPAGCESIRQLPCQQAAPVAEPGR